MNAVDWEQIRRYIAAIQPAEGERARLRQYYTELDKISAPVEWQDKTARLLADRLGM